MCPAQTLKRKNLKKISESSVDSDEIRLQQRELSAAGNRLERIEQKIAKAREQVDQTRKRLAELRSNAGERNTARNKRAIDTAKNKLTSQRQHRDKLLSEYRELKLVVRDQRALVKSLKKKEAARQAAVARFLRDWERNYDRKMRMKEKNVRIRRKIT